MTTFARDHDGHASRSTNPAADGAGAPSARLFFAARILSRLARITVAANAETPPPADAAPASAAPGAERNLCEFDYSYYVALQERRRPARVRRALG